MSSPVTKLRNVSHLYSLNSSHSHKALASPCLVNTPEFPILPDENIRHVDTPCSSKSPNLCSTPASGPFKLAYEGNPLHCHSQSISANSISTKSNGKIRPLPLPVGNLNGNQHSARKRCLGISDAISSAKFKKKPVIELIHCDEVRGLSQPISARESARCNVFSASVIPSTPPRQSKTQIFRLSGILLSPNSVSWSAESPVPIQYNASTQTVFLSSNQVCATSSTNELRTLKPRLQNPAEQCPPGKLYHWEESEEEIITEETVGRGGFGQVFRGMYRGEKVAIKRLEHAFKPRQAVLETLQGEMQGLRFCHPNIVRTLVVIQSSSLLDSKAKQRTCYVVMEHAGSRNLSQIINNINEEISESQRYRYLCDVLNGLTYLHSNKLAHLDLKPSNIIVTPNDSCKICDFGSCFPVSTPMHTGSEVNSRNSNMTTSSDSATSSSLFSGRTTSSTSSAKSSSQLMGTYVYRAPELLRGCQPTVQADIFSFSITAWQVWSRKPPYAGQHSHAAVFAVVAFGARPAVPQLSSLPNGTQEEKSLRMYFELLTQCWHADPSCRPDAGQALRSMKACLYLVQ